MQGLCPWARLRGFMHHGADLSALTETAAVLPRDVEDVQNHALSIQENLSWENEGRSLRNQRSLNALLKASHEGLEFDRCMYI